MVVSATFSTDHRLGEVFLLFCTVSAGLTGGAGEMPFDDDDDRRKRRGKKYHCDPARGHNFVGPVLRLTMRCLNAILVPAAG